MASVGWVKGLLEAKGLPYQERHHPEVFTAQEVAAEEHVSGHRLAKVVIVMADGRPVELIVPASRRVMLERVREVLRADAVRLATEDEMQDRFPDCEIGAIPPLRQRDDIEVLMDATLWVDGDLAFQAGTHRDLIAMRFADWIALVKPRVEFFTEPESAAHGLGCPG